MAAPAQAQQEPPVPKIMALRAEDHQGGGQYGALHAYGNGMGSFYVKKKNVATERKISYICALIVIFKENYEHPC